MYFKWLFDLIFDFIVIFWAFFHRKTVLTVESHSLITLELSPVFASFWAGLLDVMYYKDVMYYVSTLNDIA